MMDLKNIVNQFKTKHIQGEKILDLALLPLLLDELIADGLNISKADGKFYKGLIEETYPGEEMPFQVDIMDALLFLGQTIPLPKEEVVVVIPKPTAKAYQAIITEDGLIKTDHLIDIPDEDDEGDPLHTPLEDRIYLRPEDCAPKEYDEDFCARIGATKERR